MNALDCIKTRRSIRKFEAKPVPHDVLEHIVETARFAPSWKNSQTPRYIAVESRELIDRVAGEGVLGYDWNAGIIKGAPMLVVITSVSKRCGYERDGSFSTPKGDHWEMFDAGLAAEAFCLAAHEAGLGSVIMGIFDPEKVAEIISVPEGQTVSALIALGTPAVEPPEAPRRKEVADLLSFR